MSKSSSSADRLSRCECSVHLKIPPPCARALSDIELAYCKRCESTRVVASPQGTTLASYQMTYSRRSYGFSAMALLLGGRSGARGRRIVPSLCFCVAGRHPVCFGPSMRARLRLWRNPLGAGPRARSFRGGPVLDNNLTEICQHG